MDDLGHRLAASRTGLDRLREAIEAGEPWPLSPAYGAEPESDWGPKEVLAHVAEMVPYWLAQIEAVLAAPDEPLPFGRISTDPERIGRIGQDRVLPAAELFDRIDGSLAAVLARRDELTPADNARRGVHPRLGEMIVAAMFEPFIVGHLEDHVRQLDEILALQGTVAGDPTD